MLIDGLALPGTREKITVIIVIHVTPMSDNVVSNHLGIQRDKKMDVSSVMHFFAYTKKSRKVTFYF